MTDHPCDHAWGVSHVVHRDDRVELMRCFGRAGGSSSLHMHRHKANVFMVLCGKLLITSGETELRLARGDVFGVPAGTRHKMAFLTDAEILELYVPVPGQVIDPEDIVRFGEGQSPAAA